MNNIGDVYFLISGDLQHLARFVKKGFIFSAMHLPRWVLIKVIAVSQSGSGVDNAASGQAPVSGIV